MGGATPRQMVLGCIFLKKIHDKYRRKRILKNLTPNVNGKKLGGGVDKAGKIQEV